MWPCPSNHHRRRRRRPKTEHMPPLTLWDVHTGPASVKATTWTTPPTSPLHRPHICHICARNNNSSQFVRPFERGYGKHMSVTRPLLETRGLGLGLGGEGRGEPRTLERFYNLPLMSQDEAMCSTGPMDLVTHDVRRES